MEITRIKIPDNLETMDDIDYVFPIVSSDEDRFLQITKRDRGGLRSGVKIIFHTMKELSDFLQAFSLWLNCANIHVT